MKSYAISSLCIIVCLGLSIPGGVRADDQAEQQILPTYPLEDSKLLITNGTQEEMCTSFLDLQAFFNGSSTVAKSTDESKAASVITDAPIDTIQSIEAEESNSEKGLSFPIKSIDLPVVMNEGSVSSAMKLLSSISSQFDDEVENEGFAENVVRFQENTLHIHGLNLTMLNAHLYTTSEPKFSIGVAIRNTTLTGQFTYNGPLLLSGYYRMSIHNVYLVASSNLTKSVGSLSNPSTVLKTNEFKLNITNLGYIKIDIFDRKNMQQTTSNYLLKMLQRLLQKTIKRTYYTFESYIKEVLENESRRSLDCELLKLSPLLDQTDSLEGSLSSQQLRPADLVKILSREIIRSRFNSVSLTDFEHQQSVLGSAALIRFTNGSLSGLHHIKFTGETRIKLQDEHLYLNTSIGWIDLRAQYNWDLIIGNTGNATKTPISKGLVAFNIKGIDFDAVITKGLRPHTGFVVDQLEIRRLESPKMEISGLPGMNRITRSIVNFFMNRLKQRLANSLQPVLRQQLERALNKIPTLA